MLDTNALCKEILADAKAMWDDPEKVYEFCQTHKTRLTIDNNTFQGQRIAVLNMVARVRLEGRYEWAVMDCLGGDIMLMITRECTPEPRYDREQYPRPSLRDDNDVYYPDHPGWGG